MAYLENNQLLLMYHNKTTVKIRCDTCVRTMRMLYKSAERNKKRNGGRHVCGKCSGQPLRPQNLKSFWTIRRRKALGKSIRSSPLYSEAIASRNTAGEHNGMFGKRLSESSRQKMSLSRTGKTGANATGWKGGKMSLTRRVKEFVNRNGWYLRVYRRDNFKCVKCGSKKQIDAHHIESTNSIIRRLCGNRVFKCDDDKYKWLIKQPEIIDVTLKNGITLCRKCHKEEHCKCEHGWGSHAA